MHAHVRAPFYWRTHMHTHTLTHSHERTHILSRIYKQHTLDTVHAHVFILSCTHSCTHTCQCAEMYILTCAHTHTRVHVCDTHTHASVDSTYLHHAYTVTMRGGGSCGK